VCQASEELFCQANTALSAKRLYLEAQQLRQVAQEMHDSAPKAILAPADVRKEGPTAPRPSEALSYPMLRDEQPGSEQIKLLRAMSGQQRLEVAQRLYWSVRKMKSAGLRAQHSDWPESKVEAEVRRLFSHARD